MGLLRSKRAAEPQATGGAKKPKSAFPGVLVKAAKKLSPLVDWIPWHKLRPRVPKFKNLFGPLLVILILGLFVSYGLILKALAPDNPGKRITLTQLYEQTGRQMVKEASFLEQDSVIIVQIYEEPPAPPADASAPQPQARLSGAGGVAGKLPVAQPPPGQTSGEPPQAPGEGSGAPDEAAAQASLPAEPPTYTAWLVEPTSGAMTNIIADKLLEAGAQVSWEPQTVKKVLRFIAQFLIPLLILATVFSFFFMIITGHGSQAADFLGFSRFAAKIQRRRRGKGGVSFKDVAAIDEGIVELQEVVDYLHDPSQFVTLGARAPKGVLLVGPPGTGKTLLARAVAGEANVPFIQLSGSEFVESLVGVGAARVRDLFRQARELAPCIVFIDELDAAGRQRGAGVGGGNDEREQTLNQLLVEMDGFNPALGLCIIGATNRPDILDPALLRPGRFDRQVVIDVPDVRGRYEILQVHARNRPLAADCDLMSIAKQTPGFTGADLANILNEAALLAVRNRRLEVAQPDLEEAVDRVLAGPERKSHILTDEEKQLIAYHEAGHAVVARGVGQESGVLKLSIIARGLQLGHASTFSSADRLIMLRSEMESQLATLLGGLAAEKLFFGEVSSGNARDLEKATTLARKIVATYGMTEEVGPIQVLHEGQIFMGRDFAAAHHTSGEILNIVDAEIRRILEKAEQTAIEVCKVNRQILDQIVELLLVKETMTGPELEPLLSQVERTQLPKPLSERAGQKNGGGPKRKRGGRPVDIAEMDREEV